MAKVTAVMVNPADPNFTYEINFNSFILFLISIGLFITNIGALYLYTKVGYELTVKLRQNVFKKILNMPVSWFDNPKNSPGALSSSLATDA